MSEPILVRIDDPEDYVFRKPVCRIRGWCGGTDWTELKGLEFRIGDAHIPWQAQARPDVIADHPELLVTGFTFDLDLSQCLYAVHASELALRVLFPRAPEIELPFSVAPGVAANCLAAAGM